jgi:signal transduction histidine kinase
VVALAPTEGETRYAVAHREREAEERLRAVAARAPGPLLEGADALDGPLLVSDPLDWTMARRDVLGTLMREAGAASALLVPLAARGRALGTLVLVRYAGSPSYDAQSVPLAEELARRAALALDNASLYGELREADRRKDEFLAMLAHELRNPLSPLATSVQVLRSGAAPPVAERALSVMERQLGHVVRLVDDLLDVARVTRGRIELHREPLDLAAAVAATAENLRPRFVERGQELAVEVPLEPLIMQADATRIEQVVANLLANANKYTPRGGHVRIRVRRQGEQAVLEVRDDGIGMTRDLLGRVFDLFMQSAQALDRSQGGLGIGLTLVRQLVELHGGTVKARSDGPGQGSEFEVRLPLDATASAPPRGKVPATEAAGESGPRQVLVVDDNVEAADSLGELLRLWGHRVAVAHDGPSGLALAESEHPDVVLLDIGLPGIDGYEVGRRLRAAKATRGVLLIAVTGYGEQVHDGRLEEVGFDHLLVKPVRPLELRELLRGPVGAHG